jgi:hypothetical protein
MNMTRYGILVITILVGISLKANKVYAKELVYRPVTLTVLDAETKQPLEGIAVTVVNVAFYSKPMYFLFIPIDSKTDYVFHMYKYETNKDGIVEIPQFSYKVNRYHYLLSQHITLNLEYKDKSVKLEEQARDYSNSGHYTEQYASIFFRLQPEYKAGKISCYTYELQPYHIKQPERSIPYMTLIRKVYRRAEPERDQTSFFCGHEEFTFHLERFVEPSP